MSDHSIPHFHNSNGVREISVGAREFMCVGATPPHDHPHVFLDMGSDVEKVCPYCSTHYVHNASLKHGETAPAGCVLVEETA